MTKQTPRTPTNFDRAVDKFSNYNDRPYGVHDTIVGAGRKGLRKGRMLGAAALSGLAIGAGPAVLQKGEQAVRDLEVRQTQVDTFQRSPAEAQIIQTNSEDLSVRSPAAEQPRNSGEVHGQVVVEPLHPRW